MLTDKVVFDNETIEINENGDVVSVAVQLEEKTTMSGKALYEGRTRMGQNIYQLVPALDDGTEYVIVSYAPDINETAVFPCIDDLGNGYTLDHILAYRGRYSDNDLLADLGYRGMTYGQL